MKRVFLDANVILSFYFNDAEIRQQKAIDLAFQEIKQGSIEGHISPISFYQLLHFIDKQINNPKVAAQRAYAYLNVVQLTPFDPLLLSRLDIKMWPDYEDGLQYICAKSGHCDIIVTTNSEDFFASSLPVVDPLNFALQYLNR